MQEESRLGLACVCAQVYLGTERQGDSQRLISSRCQESRKNAERLADSVCKRPQKEFTQEDAPKMKSLGKKKIPSAEKDGARIFRVVTDGEWNGT